MPSSRQQRSISGLLTRADPRGLCCGLPRATRHCPHPQFQGETVVSCGSGVVVGGEQVSDAAHRVAGLEGDVVGDPTDGAHQGEQFGPGVRVLGRWDAVGHGRLPGRSRSRPAVVSSRRDR